MKSSPVQLCHYCCGISWHARETDPMNFHMTQLHDWRGKIEGERSIFSWSLIPGWSWCDKSVASWACGFVWSHSSVICKVNEVAFLNHQRNLRIQALYLLMWFSLMQISPVCQATFTQPSRHTRTFMQLWPKPIWHQAHDVILIWKCIVYYWPFLWENNTSYQWFPLTKGQ